MSALLQLNVTKAPLCAMETRYVKTACLPTQAFPDGKMCSVTGWGRTGKYICTHYHLNYWYLSVYTLPTEPQPNPGTERMSYV